MSQQIRVLQCIECKLFQVDIVKKSNKWQCKVCNVKQDVVKEFIRGSSQECRIRAQELNFNYGKQQEKNEAKALERHMKDYENFTKTSQQMEANDGTEERLSKNSSRNVSKWNEFVDTASKNLKDENLEDPSTLVMPNSERKQMISGSSLGEAASNQKKNANKRQHSGETTMTTFSKKPSSYNKWNNFI